ncbi:hypothetical protein CS078_22095 [Pseudomonas prosekii]|uniref:Uncharacterized protein n=1 Tax=Pseudomonas prosekii TaxID=1148509 RepID=A0A3L8CDB9_9PSED|nr:hypothetical protein [Pseudomonas prosekii]RLU05911.1 hypothetical protein CS076_22575 [Pseudomonas prosekii]RLU06129.1 hypothetical protein CS078_22095 [Pseudomonas prosekii]
MTDARKTPVDPVIEHFREHGSDGPPSHLDAFILAAAHREAPVRKPSLWQRWVQACQKPRWQVAFASLVGVALMVTLVQRTPEQELQYDAAPAPKTSSFAARKEAPAPVARSLAAPPPAAPMAELAAPAQSESLSAAMADEAKVSKRAAAPLKPLDEQLREVIRLQNAGQTQAADELLKTLHQRFPDENLAARLKALKKN